MAKKIIKTEVNTNFIHCIWTGTCTKDSEDPRFHLCCAVCKSRGLNSNCSEICNAYNEGTCDCLVSEEYIRELANKQNLLLGLPKSPTKTTATKKLKKQKEQEEIQKRLEENV